MPPTDRRPKRSAKKKASHRRKEFTMHPNWLLRSRLGPPTRCVYAGLLSHLPYGEQDGVVWPAVETIAFEGGVCERAAYNALHELRDAGLGHHQEAARRAPQ